MLYFLLHDIELRKTKESEKKLKKNQNLRYVKDINIVNNKTRRKFLRFRDV